MFIASTRSFTIIAFIVFVATILFCTWSASAMTTDGHMNDCATRQSQIALCGVSPRGHLLAWQNFLYLTPQKVFNLLLATLLLAIGFFVSRTWHHVPPLVAQYLRTRIQEGLSIVDPIRRALARGIIQPKIYELAIG